MRVLLKVVAGLHTGRSVLLHDGQTVRIGRTEWADHAFADDPQMSSVHCEIRCDARRCVIRDLESTNGTRVDGNEVDEHVLDHGATIKVGQTEFLVQFEDVAPPTTVTGRAEPDGPQTQPATAATSPADVAVVSHALDLLPEEGLPYRAALQDEDPCVRWNALLAAATTRSKWLLDHCRRAYERPCAENWDAVHLLAVLGKPEDLARITAVCRQKGLGSRPIELLGTYGHPAVVELLLREMRRDAPPAVVAAGVAFAKLTGADIDSEYVVQLPAEDGGQSDELDEDSLDEAVLPSFRLASEHWKQVQSQFSGSTRICRGLDLSEGADESVLAQLDMQSRGEACLRGRFAGTQRGSLADFEAFSIRPTLVQ